MSESRWREIGSLFSLERSRYLSDHATSKPCNCRHFMLCGLFHWKGFFSVWITFSGFNIYRISCYVLKISSKLIMMKISSKLGFSFPHLLFPVPYESTVKFNRSPVKTTWNTYLSMDKINVFHKGLDNALHIYAFQTVNRLISRERIRKMLICLYRQQSAQPFSWEIALFAKHFG